MDRKKIVVAVFCFLIWPFFTKAKSLSDVNINDTIVKEQYRNPVIPGDFPDPSIVRVGEAFYATGTSSEWAPHYPVFRSTDLVNWTQTGYVFPQKPAWTSSSFWAPELFGHDGKLYVYYTARDTNNISCIGVAVADSAGGAFRDKGILVRTGSEAIDAFVFDDDGQLYITWKAYGLDKRPIEILSSKLSPDGLHITSTPVTLLKDSVGKGMEGQSMVKHKGYYYLFYSAGSCCGVPCDYHVRVARSRQVEGPYEAYANNPILQGNAEWMCTGHGTPVALPGDRMAYLYHAYNRKDNVFTGRQGMLDVLHWDESSGWPYFAEGKASSVAPLPMPGDGQEITHSWRDDFDSSTLALRWQWNFRAYTPAAKIAGGRLSLSGKPVKTTSSGVALCVRPLAGDYTIATEVVNTNAAAKGLVMYVDANTCTGIAIAGRQVQLWQVKDDKRTIIARKELQAKGPVQLQIRVENGYRLAFAYRLNNNNPWQPLVPGTEQGYDASFLKQWDRSPRPGLIQFGNSNEPAIFSYFEMNWL